MNELFRIKASALERIRLIPMAPIELKVNNFIMITIIITPAPSMIPKINVLENCIKNFAIY